MRILTVMLQYVVHAQFIKGIQKHNTHLICKTQTKVNELACLQSAIIGMSDT